MRVVWSILAAGLIARAAPAGDPSHSTGRRAFAVPGRLNRALDALLAPRRRRSAPGNPERAGGDAPGGRPRPNAGSSDEGSGRRDPFAPLIAPLDLGKLQKRVEARWGLDAGDVSDKPEAPDIPEPVFIEFIRPLGALKYESEANYLVVAPTAKTPLSQFLEYEYVFSDWNAVKLEMEFSEGALETLEPGYQRTLGVGRRHNWVHGFQVNPEVFLRTGFVGGTALYILGWKPEEKSPYSVAAWLGANRSQFDAEPSRTFPTVGGGLSTLSALRSDPRDGGQNGPGAWRTVANLDFWYTLGPSLSVGMENDALIHRRFGEYLVMPHVNWEPTEHFFVQVGAGYYQLGHEHQAIFMAHVNFVNPTRRKPRVREEGSDAGEDRPRRRLFGRR